MAIKGLLFPQSHCSLMALVINILEFHGNTLKTDMWIPVVLMYIYIYFVFSCIHKHFRLSPKYDGSIVMLMELCYHVLECSS